MKILALGTSNRCLSLMTEGLLNNLALEWAIFSAFINPANEVQSRASHLTY